MARTKSSKNKPAPLVVERKPPDTTEIVGRKHWGATVYYVMEQKTKSKAPELHSYTENEAGAYAAVKILEDMKPGSKFTVISAPNKLYVEN